MSNGYAMSAVIGKPYVMEAAQRSFISSTYWTERVGPAAAIATIRKHRRCNVAEHLIKVGLSIQAGWSLAAARANLKLEIGGIPPLSHFSFVDELNQEARTLFTQLMLEKGFLATNSFYASFAHQEQHVVRYLEAAEEVFNVISAALRDGSLTSQLIGPIAHTGFQRLT